MFPTDEFDLQAHGIDRTEAAELQASLATFAADWDAPEMDVYDNYDAAKCENAAPVNLVHLLP